MARLLKAKGKKAGMGAAKFPGGKKKAAGKKVAKSSAKSVKTTKKAKVVAAKGKGHKRRPDPSKWAKRKKPYAWQLGEGQIKQRIAKYRQKHSSLTKAARPALPKAVKAYARKYFAATRKSSKLRMYDKVRGAFYRKTLKDKYGTTNTSFYAKGFKAGRRPRKGSRTRVYKKTSGKRGRPAGKKTAAKKAPAKRGRPAKKTVAKRGRGRPAKKK